MTSLAEKLEELEYGESPTPLEFLEQDVAELLPEDYRQFLRTFPRTGSFNIGICAAGLQAAPCAPDKLYPISSLFAFSENDRHDLATIREHQSVTPRHFLIIGCDDGGNQFLLDLRKESRGHVYYHDHEVPIEAGVYLVAESFAKFINSLRTT